MRNPGHDATAASPQIHASVIATIERTSLLIAAENRALSRHDLEELRPFPERKSQALLELSSALAVLGGRADGRVVQSLEALRALLDRNRRLLEIEHAAVKDMAHVLAAATADAASDMTYSARRRSGGA